MLILCGCVGQSGGGWAHYVGREKLRPQTAGSRWRSPRRQRPRAIRNTPRTSTTTPASGAMKP
ncbi:molybdopterin-dependent oxidoreductase [Klebsiella quasipneumoniae subsp. similipneumoniae]